ncbi:hypothetical protein B0H65DRAFT_454293 [Neurospora tetraspora]|uniref:Uncharacterized protein n=1 Tax=Neurospora tetraspora TaxID=94610 RepID=A0AAE0JRP0_9PEZI|nr:hypothetical protein B0H65DRAFT_454293 [Neurospora tetraspora]
MTYINQPVVLTSFPETDAIFHDIGLQMPTQSEYRVLSLMLLSAEDVLKGRTLQRIEIVEQAFRTKSHSPCRPAIIFCLEDSKDGKRKGMDAFIELQTRLMDSTASDLSSVPILPIARYTVLPSLLGWLEMWGLPAKFFDTLPFELRDDKPPWPCTLSNSNNLVPRSAMSSSILNGPPFCLLIGKRGSNARGLINVVIAKAGMRAIRKTPRETSQETGQAVQEYEGQAKVERVVAFWLKEYILDH